MSVWLCRTLKGMGKYRKLTDVVYQCNYHIVWVPKYRFRILTGAVGEMVERDIRMLCEWKDVEVMELSVQEDHVTIPPAVGIRLHGAFESESWVKLFYPD